MSDRTSTVFRRLTGLALGVALCAGCTASGGEEPTEPASSAGTSEAATPEPSPTPVPPYDGTVAPQIAPEMSSGSHLGARAAVAYFVDVRHWAFATGDPSGLVALCDPNSIFCSSAIDAVNKNRELGRTVAGGLTTLKISSVEPPKGEQAFFKVLGEISEAPLTITDGSGTTVESTEGYVDLPFVFYVEFEESGWIVRGADRSQ